MVESEWSQFPKNLKQIYNESQQYGKILNELKEIKDNFDNYMESDLKTSLVLLKDVLISFANDVYPDLEDVRTLYLKAVE